MINRPLCHKPVIFKSSSMIIEDIGLFQSGLKYSPRSISITFDDGFHLGAGEDEAEFKVYMQVEPPEVMEYLHAQEGIEYDTRMALLANHTHYDLILTWDELILKYCPNAVLFPQALCTWIDQCYTVVK